MIDAVANGALMGEKRDEAYELLKEITSNSYQWQSERVTLKKAAGVDRINILLAVHARLALLTKALGASNVSAIHSPSSVYYSYVGGQTNGGC